MNPQFLGFLHCHRHLAETTRDIQRGWLRRFEDFCARRGLNWRTCTPQTLDLFHQHLLWNAHSRGGLFSPNTVDQALRLIRHFYRWAHGRGLVATDPTSTWCLPRPPQPPQPTLTREETLRLLNLPDLGVATGQRDLLLLELVYTLRLSCDACLLLNVGWDEQFEPLRQSWERYLNRGRGQLLRVPTDRLLLSNRGRPYTSGQSLRLILRAYGRQLGHPHLTARTLHRSAREHEEQLGERFRLP